MYICNVFIKFNKAAVFEGHKTPGSIADDISKKNLKVKIFKVPAHSGNLLNDRADALARVATSPSSSNIPCYTPSTHSSFFSTRIVFNSSLLLEINPRSFYSALCDAALFEQFISLDRMAKYKSLSSHINWVITWSFFNYVHQFTSQHLRSKMESFQRTFKLKLLYEELPLMNNLIRRRPDLYQNASCFHCSTGVENQDHLWTCDPASHLNRRSRLQDFQSIISLARDSLISTLQKKWKSQSLHKHTVITQIYQLQCWELTSQPDALTSVDLLKGLFPHALYSSVHEIIGSHEHTVNLLYKTVYKLQLRLYQFIWLRCCYDFSEWEISQHITTRCRPL